MSKSGYYTFVMLIVWLPIVLVGQSRSCRLNVYDGSSYLPIDGVDVMASTGEFIVKTRLNGHCEIQFEADSLMIGLYHEGYSFRQLWIHLDSTMKVALYPLSFELTEVQVSAFEGMTMGSLDQISSDILADGKRSEVVRMDNVSANLATNNARQIYSQVVGLNIYEGSSGGLQTSIGGRGLDPNRTSNFNTRQNGYDISADVLGYPESYYTPPSESLERIEILRGAASLQFGTQFGGLINYKIRELNDQSRYELQLRQTVGSFGFMNSFVQGGLRRGKWELNGFLNYKQGDGYRDNSMFEAYNGFLNLRYDLSLNTTIRAEWTKYQSLAQQAGGLTDALFESNPRQSLRSRNWFHVDWNLFQLHLTHDFSKHATLTAQLFGLMAERSALGFRGDPRSLNSNPITDLDEKGSGEEYVSPRDLIHSEFRNWGAEIKYALSYPFMQNKNRILIGSKIYDAHNSARQGAGSQFSDADFRYYDQQYLDYPNQSNFSFPNRNVALFVEHVARLSNRWSIIPGARWEWIDTNADGVYLNNIYDNAGNLLLSERLEDNQEFDRNFLLFGVGSKYIFDRMTLIANFSQNYRSVTFSDIRVVNPSFIVDPNITDERGYTADVGINGLLDKKLHYNFGAYLVSYDNRIGIILDDRANRVRKNIGKARIIGLESMVEADLLKFLTDDKRLNGKRIRSVHCFSNLAFTHAKYLESEAVNIEGKRVEFVPEWNIKLGGRVDLERSGLSVQFSYLSDQYTDGQNSKTPDRGDSRSGLVGNIPSYSIWDMGLYYQFGAWRVDCGVNNLFNKSYFTRRATGYPGPGIIPSDGRNFYLTLSYQLKSGH